MSGFLTSLMNRHIGAGINIFPRSRGRYESDQSNFNTNTTKLTEQIKQVSISDPEKPASQPADEISSGTKTEINQNEKIIKGRETENLIPSGKVRIYPDNPESKSKIPFEPGEFKVKESYKPDDTGNSKSIKSTGMADEKMKKPDIVITNKTVNIHSLSKDLSHDGTGQEPRRTSGIKPVQENDRTGKMDKLKIEVNPELNKTEGQKHQERKKIIEKKDFNQSGSLIPPTAGETISYRNKSAFIDGTVSHDQARSSSSNDTTIKVSIGRIEIKAVNQPPVEKKDKHSPAPVMTLEEYLNRQSKNWK